MPHDPTASSVAEPTDAELDLLKLLWQFGAATIRDLTDRRHPNGTTAQYATVQKLLERLRGKNLVRRGPAPDGGRAHVYAAAVDRDALIGHRLRATAEALCEGSMTPLVSHLVDARAFTDDDVDALRALVDRLSATSADDDPHAPGDAS
ncbi:MAG: BlaI/MecI/CopY family transcriptional regulator [Acidobacteriota bacterium]